MPPSNSSPQNKNPYWLWWSHEILSHHSSSFSFFSIPNHTMMMREFSIWFFSKLLINSFYSIQILIKKIWIAFWCRDGEQSFFLSDCQCKLLPFVVGIDNSVDWLIDWWWFHLGLLCWSWECRLTKRMRQVGFVEWYLLLRLIMRLYIVLVWIVCVCVVFRNWKG